MNQDFTAFSYEKEDRFRKLIEGLNVITYEFDLSVRKFIYVSRQAENILGYPSEEWFTDRFWYEHLHPSDRDWASAFSRKQTELLEDHEYEYRMIAVDGTVKWFKDITSVITEGEIPKTLQGVLVDITERKNTEAKLEETQTRLTAVLNNLPNVVFYENAVEKQFISPNIVEMLGYPSEEFYKNTRLFDSLIHPEDIERVVKEYAQWNKSGSKGTYKELFRIKRKDGKYIWLEDHVFKVMRADGKSYILGVMIDVTEQKSTEEKIISSLEEKELLLKEIHHRVKNNLQVVSSLLKLQTNYVKDDISHDILLDSQNRVRSMALVHQKLYQSKDFSQIDFTDYIVQLTENLFEAYKNNNEKIDLSIKTDEAKISIDIAIPCGLIINELVTNSLKYAFPAGNSGKVEIELNHMYNNHYELIVKDNGAGFPEHIDFKNTNTLGLQLVNTLVGQIDGDIEMENHVGTTYKIKFINNHYKPRA